MAEPQDATPAADEATIVLDTPVVTESAPQEANPSGSNFEILDI